jgi:putative transposase
VSRPSRTAVLGDGFACVHLITRFNNGEFFLQDPALKSTLRSLLLTHKKAFQIRIHHYCFMDSHIHLIVSFDSTHNLSKFMHAVFFRLAHCINKRLNRKGHVFLDRARTPVIQAGKRLLTTMRYLDLNPVRAQIVDKATHYRWSAYRHYAYGEKDELIDEASDYLGLSRVPALRRRQYRELVQTMSGKGTQRLPELTVWTFIGDRDWVLTKLKTGGFLRMVKPPG